jgi:hypothetical protein
MILGRQVGREAGQGRDVDLASLDELEQDWKAPRQSSCRNPVVGLVVAQPEIGPIAFNVQSER